MNRTLFVRLDLSTDLPDHDAFYTDEAGLSFAAVWLEQKLSGLADVEATVYGSLSDMIDMEGEPE